MASTTNRLFGIFGLFRRRRQLPSPAPAVNVASSASTLSFTERRQAPRRWGNPIQVFIWDGNPASEPARGWIVNRSTTGLGLSWAQPVAEGTQLQVRIAVAPETVPWTQLHIRYCIPQTGRWILGGEFVQPPPHDVLLMFR